MAELNGINTHDNAAAIRAKLYSGVLRAELEPELIGMNYVDMVDGFTDGDSFEDLELGSSGALHDYIEGSDITFDGVQLGTREFRINNYVYSGHFVTEKFTQDSYLSAQIMAKLPSMEARKIAETIEAKIFGLQEVLQKPSDSNLVDDYRLRFTAGYVDGMKDRIGSITPEDIAYGVAALSELGYNGNLVLIVPPFQQYKIPQPVMSQALSYNPRWEGIVRDGAMSGTRFAFNLVGVDVYTSNFLPVINEKSLKLHAGETAKTSTKARAALLFANTPDRRPFRFCWRMKPKFEGEWNMHKRREEYVTVSRFGVGAGESKNLVVMACAEAGTKFA